MKIAITGGTGFVGRHVARMLAADGHEVVLIARGCDRTDLSIRRLANCCFWETGLESAQELAKAFSGAEVVIHCAGINREWGEQTYQRIHIDGTRNVVEAAKQGNVKKIIHLSFLRALPHCGSGYHESKWAAEEIVRGSGLDYTVLKCGVIYGRGDHMLDHLSHAFHTFPAFAFVGFRDQPIRPNAIADVARLIKAAAVDGALTRKTVAVLGPEQLTLRQAVRRVASVVGKRPLMFPLPVWFHYILGWLVERIMVTPLVSTAQVQMLSEGLVEPAPPCELVPDDLAPRLPFSEEQIRAGLPPPGPFGWQDLRCCRRPTATRGKIAFLEMP
jgi:NADH dehydrogenase